MHTWIMGSLQPPLQPHPILREFEVADANAAADDPAGRGITGHARDPLISDVELVGREPGLRQHRHFSRPGMEHEDSAGSIVFAGCRIGANEQQLVHTAKFRRNFDRVLAGGETRTDLHLGQGCGGRIDAVLRALEPSGDIAQRERRKLVGIKAKQAQVAGLGTPYPQPRLGHDERTAIRIQRQQRRVRLLPPVQRDQVLDLSFGVAGPGVALAGSAGDFRERLPVPRRWADGLLDELLLPDGVLRRRPRRAASRSGG